MADKSSQRRKQPNSVAKSLIRQWLKDESFSLTEVELRSDEVDAWVQLRNDPRRFQPSIFLGAWADPQSHPQPDEIRILRVMTGPDRVTRAIARQGKYLYAFPWM